MRNLSTFTQGTLQEILLRNSLIDYLTEQNIDFRILPSYKTYSYKLNKYADIDLLLITPVAIYAIETKSFRSHIRGTYNEKMWKGNSFNHITHIYNPVFQNKEHIRSLNTILIRNGFARLPIKNVVCIQNCCKNKTDCKEVINESQLLSKVVLDNKYDEKIIDVKNATKVLLRFAL